MTTDDTGPDPADACGEQRRSAARDAAFAARAKSRAAYLDYCRLRAAADAASAAYAAELGLRWS